MYLKIQNDIVRKNVEILKIILKQAIQAREESKVETLTQCFNAYVHRIRGEIRFPDLTDHSLNAYEWSKISFVFSLPSNMEDSFSLDISDTNSTSFSWDSLDPKAFSTLRETLKTIQFISKFLPRLKQLSAVLREFSLMNLDTFLDELPTKDLIHEAWHSVQRAECEQLLLEHPPGVFLFRQDIFASILEKELSYEHKKNIKCITLSYVSALKKVSDLTLVKQDIGWVIYNDDPSLNSCTYPSARSLLESLRGILKTPLLHTRE